ncbi:MAG: hypothetical protein AAB309_03935 [Deltaproteobacteria bacterium]
MRLKISALLIFFLVSLPCYADFSQLTFYGFDQEALSKEGKEGLDHIFAGDLFRSAIPLSIFLESQGSIFGWIKAIYYASSPQNQFMVYGRLPSPKTRQPGTLSFVPVSLGNSVIRRRGIYLFNENCFSCHAGVVRGIVTAGLGNSHVDQVSLSADIKKLADLSDVADVADARQPDRSQEEEEEFRDLIEYAKTLMLPTFKYAKSRGDNLGPFSVWKMLSRLIDPEKKGLLTYSSRETAPLDPWFNSLSLPPVDPNPWWHLKYKTNCYRYGDATPYDANHFSGNFTHPHPRVNEEHKTHVGLVSKALAFARETTSPPYPSKLNNAQVERGRKLFHGEIPISNGRSLSCYRCHGSYERDERFTDLSNPGGWIVHYESTDPPSPPKDVGTDLAYSDLLMSFGRLEEAIGQLKTFYERRGESELIPHSRIPRRSGYLPPPLVGVWASAPYFHNGSVPTMELVLNSSKRPEIWKRNNEDPFSYDLQNVGLPYSMVTKDRYEQLSKEAMEEDLMSQTRIDFRAIYDTRDFGRANRGHLFGDTMTDEERLSVIEFLKSLSGPNMTPYSN